MRINRFEIWYTFCEGHWKFNRYRLLSILTSAIHNVYKQDGTIERTRERVYLFPRFVLSSVWTMDDIRWINIELTRTICCSCMRIYVEIRQQSLLLFEEILLFMCECVVITVVGWCCCYYWCYCRCLCLWGIFTAALPLSSHIFQPTPPPPTTTNSIRRSI